jgi:aryl-alcohol dehydrogenase-like predicted oxidoreductase
MEKRAFGQLETKVSPIGFGGASISGEGGGYGFGDIAEQEAIRLVQKAFEAGINLFDTAPVYGFGLSEQRIGKAIDPEQREDWFLISKSGVDWDMDKRTRIDNSPSTTLRMLHQSLRNLRTEYIDLFLVHWPDPNVDIRSTMEILVRAREEEKIRAIGLSNFGPKEIEKALEVGRVDVLQHHYNAFERTFVQEQIFPVVERHALGLMSYGTLDKGILTGRVTPDRTFDSSDVRSRAPWWKNSPHHLKYEALDEILPLLESQGHTGLELALGFVLSHPQVSTALCGVRTEEQLNSAIAALNNPLSADLLEEVLEIADEYLER